MSRYLILGLMVAALAAFGLSTMVTAGTSAGCPCPGGCHGCDVCDCTSCADCLCCDFGTAECCQSGEADCGMSAVACCVTR